MGLPVQQNELRSVAVAARVQLANRPVLTVPEEVTNL